MVVLQEENDRNSQHASNSLVRFEQQFAVHTPAQSNRFLNNVEIILPNIFKHALLAKRRTQLARVSFHDEPKTYSGGQNETYRYSSSATPSSQSEMVLFDLCDMKEFLCLLGNYNYLLKVLQFANKIFLSSLPSVENISQRTKKLSVS